MSWDENIPGAVERHSKLNDEMKKVGDKKTLRIKSEEPNKIPKSILEKAREKNGHEFSFEARDSYNLLLEENGVVWEFWFSATAYSILRELKAVKEANNGTLAEAMVSVERLAVSDPTKANWRISAAE